MMSTVLAYAAMFAAFGAKFAHTRYLGPYQFQECRRSCPVFQSPVCGSDGVTYQNGCKLSNAACSDPYLRYLYKGECRKVDKTKCNRHCNLILSPVCGSDGKTYSNACALSVAACHNPTIWLLSLFPCKNDDAFIKAITNSSNQAGHSSFVEYPIKQTDELQEGKKKNCHRPCPRIMAPVCGSDGKTYDNKCIFEMAVCRDSSIRLVSLSSCGKDFIYANAE